MVSDKNVFKVFCLLFFIVMWVKWIVIDEVSRMSVLIRGRFCYFIVWVVLFVGVVNSGYIVLNVG